MSENEDNLHQDTHISEENNTTETLQEIEGMSNEKSTSTEGEKEQDLHQVAQVEMNFKDLRASKRKIEKERDEYMARLKELEAVNRKPVQNDYEDDYEDDTKKEINALKNELRNYQVNTTAITIENKLKSEYNDFDNVVNKDNLDILSTKYPEIAKTIKSSSDLYGKAVTAYTLIKKFGIHLDDQALSQKQRVTDNLNKPRPAGTIKSDSPLSHAKDFSDLSSKEVRDDILRKAMEFAKNA